MCSWNFEIIIFFYLFIFFFFHIISFQFFSCFNTLELDKGKVSCECNSCYSFIFLYILQAFKWIFSYLSLGLLMPRPPVPTAL